MTIPLPLIYLAIFIFTVAAVFLISDLGKGIDAELKRSKKSGAMKIKKRTLLTKLLRIEQKRRRLVADSQILNSVYWLLTGFGAIGGVAIGKVFFHEMLLATVVGVLGAVSPLLFLSYKLNQSKSQHVEKLQSSMMLLSNSYIATEDFIKSVQDNIDMLEYQAPFRDFLTYVNLIDSNIKTGLRRMENQADNIYYSQWIDVLVMAQDDRRLKYVMMSVVDAMNDVHQAQREADTAMYTVWREYLTVLILIFSTPMIFRVLMKPAYMMLVTTFPGHVLFLLLLATVVFSLVRAVQLNKPILM